jgi:serine/threonine-protein kinase RsbW
MAVRGIHRSGSLTAVHTSVSVRLDVEPRSVAIARDACAATLGRLGVETECIEHVTLAVAEACANVVEHARPDDGAASAFDVRIDVVGEWCHVDVVDRGRGFDPSAVRFELPAPPSTRGRGLGIMRRVVDDVVVTTAEGAGTRVLLSKRLAFEPWSPLAAAV